MAKLYSVPSFSTLKVEQFKGLDCSVSEDQMKPYRAADSKNMIPGAVGEVKKRPGVQQSEELRGLPFEDGDKITRMIGGKHPVIHPGNYLASEWIYYKKDSGYQLIATSYWGPMVVPYKDGWIVFANLEGHVTDFKDDGIPMSIGKTGYTAAIILIDVKERVRAYTDTGMCCILNDSGTWESTRIEADDEFLTTPIILQGGDPAGGGSPYQQINLLNPWVTESFCCKGEKTSVFYLQDKVSDITDSETRWSGSDKAGDIANNFQIEILTEVTYDDTGANEKITKLVWAKRPIHAGDGFRPSANRIYLHPEGNKSCTYIKDATGTTQTINVGDGNNNWIKATPVEGEDNVRITHWRASFQEDFIRLCSCVCGTSFGVGGYKDRLFIAGGAGEYGYYKDRIYYSELEDPFYIGALDYLQLDSECRVMALDGTAGTLAALTDQGIYLIQASAQNNTEDTGYVSDALFTVSGRVRAPAPLGYGNTAVLGGEIVYLSKEGVIAIAYKENFDERFAEHRSALIDRKMLADGPLQLLSLGRFLMIRCSGGVWWLLDENQPNSEGDKPYSSHQYEGYRLTGMYADTAWTAEDQLRLVRGNYQYCWTDGTAGDHYHDEYDGAETAIKAYWETPWLYGGDFYRNKTFKRLGLLLDQVVLGGDYADSSVKVEGRKNDETEDEWKILLDYDGTLCSFDYGRLDYRLFTYAGAPGLPMIARKIKIKKAKRVKLLFSNDFIDQTLILRQFGLDYVQGG